MRPNSSCRYRLALGRRFRFQACATGGLSNLSIPALIESDRRLPRGALIACPKRHLNAQEWDGTAWFFQHAARKLAHAVSRGEMDRDGHVVVSHFMHSDRAQPARRA
jgi:hypothetical protein